MTAPCDHAALAAIIKRDRSAAREANARAHTTFERDTAAGALSALSSLAHAYSLSTPDPVAFLKACGIP